MPSEKPLVEVVPYQNNWPELFTAEAGRIQEALGDNCIAVHHIGSTAIPDLQAKPLIDIIVVVKSLSNLDPKIHFMKQLGYEPKGEYGIAFRRFFQKGKPVRTHNVHIYEENSPEIEHALLFRDYLISRVTDKKRYGALKLALAKSHPDDLDSYWQGKEPFIHEILKKTKFTGYRMLQALTPSEWEAYHRLHEMHHIKTTSVSQDLNQLNVSDKNHYHFMFIQGTQIIGAAHVEFIHDNQATIRTCLIDSQIKNEKEHIEHFVTWLKKWILYQGRTFKQTNRS